MAAWFWSLYGDRKKSDNHYVLKEKRRFSRKKDYRSHKSKHINSFQPSDFYQSPKTRIADRTANQNIEEPLRGMLILGLIEASILKFKLSIIKALHTQWKDEKQRSFPQGKKLVKCQIQYYKNISMLVIGFTLSEAQVDIICTIFYGERGTWRKFQFSFSFPH